MPKPHTSQTATGRVRGLGSAQEGVGHFIKQRVTAIGLIILVPWFMISLIGATRDGYAGAANWVASPVNVILLLIVTGAAFFHMRIGMQVIIEDYIARSSTRIALLILNTFVAVLLFVAAAFSIIRIALAG